MRAFRADVNQRPTMVLVESKPVMVDVAELKLRSYGFTYRAGYGQT
jgi:hypothetical protein